MGKRLNLSQLRHKVEQLLTNGEIDGGKLAVNIDPSNLNRYTYTTNVTLSDPSKGTYSINFGSNDPDFYIVDVRVEYKGATDYLANDFGAYVYDVARDSNGKVTDVDVRYQYDSGTGLDTNFDIVVEGWVKP